MLGFDFYNKNTIPANAKLQIFALRAYEHISEYIPIRDQQRLGQHVYMLKWTAWIAFNAVGKLATLA